MVVKRVVKLSFKEGECSLGWESGSLEERGMPGT